MARSVGPDAIKTSTHQPNQSDKDVVTLRCSYKLIFIVHAGETAHCSCSSKRVRGRARDLTVRALLQTTKTVPHTRSALPSLLFLSCFRFFYPLLSPLDGDLLPMLAEKRGNVALALSYETWPGAHVEEKARGTVFVIFSLAYPSLSACRSEEPRRDRSRSTFPRPEAGTARGSNNRTCQRDRARGDPFPTSVCKFPSKRSPKPTRNDLLSFTGRPDGREYTMTYPRPNDWQFLNAGT